MAAQPNLHRVQLDLEVTIDRPVAEVFAYVADVGNLPEWQHSAVAAEWVEPGVRFRERRSFLGRTADVELEVTASEPDRRFDVRSVTGPVRFVIRHSFEPAGEGTLVRLEAVAKVGGVLRFAAAMAQHEAQRHLRADLARLKEVLERRDEESPSDRPPRLAAQ
jgi:uncharacterized membrane protein